MDALAACLLREARPPAWLLAQCPHHPHWDWDAQTALLAALRAAPRLPSPAYLHKLAAALEAAAAAAGDDGVPDGVYALVGAAAGSGPRGRDGGGFLTYYAAEPEPPQPPPRRPLVWVWRSASFSDVSTGV